MDNSLFRGLDYDLYDFIISAIKWIFIMKKYKEPEQEYKKRLTQSESLLISSLARQDKKIFSIEDARGVTDRDARKIM